MCVDTTDFLEYIPMFETILGLKSNELPLFELPLEVGDRIISSTGSGERLMIKGLGMTLSDCL